MGVSYPKIMRYLAVLFVISIFVPVSSQRLHDQFLDNVADFLNRDIGTDLKEGLVGNMTRDEKTSIKEGLLLLLEMLKDEGKDSLALRDSTKSRQIDSLSNKDLEESIEEDAESEKVSDYPSKKITKPSMNGETGDVANDNIIHVLSTNNQSNDQDSFNTYKLWKEQKKERAKQSRSSSRAIKDERKCPRDYVLAPTQGDVPGPALISLGTTNIPANKERCAEICDHNSRCRSFLYSPTEGECKITSHLDPTSNDTYRDWIMCSKKDVECERGYIRKYGSVHGDKGSLLAKKMAEETGVYAPTDNECRSRCDKDQECKTYEYSPAKQRCIIRNVTDPKANTTGYEDFRWCSKITCKTIDGPVVNAECKFPFIWREKEYFTCTNVGDYNDGRFWCPTAIGDVMADKDSKTWGYCNDTCPRHETHCYAIAGPGIGKDCIFPFSDRGKIYRHCAKSYPSGMPKWCKTDKNEALSDSINSYGICHSGCDAVTDCAWEKLGPDGIVAQIEGATVGGGNYTGQTLDQCKDLCNLNSECKSFSFRVEDGKCTLKDMILNRNSKTKKVPGTCTYYEPAACHDDDGFQVSVGYHKPKSRSLHNRIVMEALKKIARENDGGNDSREKDEVKGFRDEYESGSRNVAKGHRTRERNGGDGMEAGYDSRSDVSHNGDSRNDGHDTSDTKNAFHGVMEALKKFEKITHENEGGNDSREKDEVKGFRDEYESGSRNVAKVVSKENADRSKHQKKHHPKIWDKVHQHENLLQELSDLRNDNT